MEKFIKADGVNQIETKIIENSKERQQLLNGTLVKLKNILNDTFYDNVYDFSDQSKQIEFIRVVKRLFHPRAIVEVERNGKIQKKIITKNYSHNNEDKSMILDNIYINYILRTKNGLGGPSGVDSTEIPKAEYKSAKNKSYNKLAITNSLVLGQIDKIDEKNDNKHNIYNTNSKISLVSGIFEPNSIVPIIVFYVEYHQFQQIVNKLIKAAAEIYKNAIDEIASINTKINSKEINYRIGDQIKLNHLKKEVVIVSNDNKATPQLIQTPRDTLTLVLGDFISSPGLKIIHIDEKWRSKISISKELIIKNPNLKTQIKQFYTDKEFKDWIFMEGSVSAPQISSIKP